MSARVRVDTWVQSAVDFVMFAIMRTTGWGRSVIRYRIAMGPILALSVLFAGMSASEFGAGIGAVTFIIWAGLCVLGAKADRIPDEIAENKGLARPPRPSRFLNLGFCGMNVVFVAAGYQRSCVVAGLVFALDGFLAWAAATPSIPPPLRMAKLATVEGT